MDLVSWCPLQVGSVIWRPRADVWALTVVCKATYLLRPGESQLAQVQAEVNEVDGYWNDDPNRSLHFASDLAPFKRNADVMLIGHAFAPQARPVRSLVARLIVAGVDKSIEVFGNRSWTIDGALREVAPFTIVPLRWERAGGSPGTENPVGVRADAPPDAYGERVLPNLQPPGMHVARPGDFIEPVGFGPIAPTWRGRTMHLYGHAVGWSHERWAERPMPWDINPSYFNAAPPDQQVYELRSDDRLVLENLHPEHPRLVTNLVKILPRAVVERVGALTEEIALRCDTLTIDTDRGVCMLVFRGRIWLHHPAEAGRVVVRMDAPGAVTDEAEETATGPLSTRDDATTLFVSTAREPAAREPALPFFERQSPVQSPDMERPSPIPITGRPSLSAADWDNGPTTERPSPDSITGGPFSSPMSPAERPSPVPITERVFFSSPTSPAKRPSPVPIMEEGMRSSPVSTTLAPPPPSLDLPDAAPRPGFAQRLAATVTRSVAAPDLTVAAVPAPQPPHAHHGPPPWVRAYRPSWILPRRRSSLHVYVFAPEAQGAVRRDAHSALDVAGNPARESHAIPLRYPLEPGEPLIVCVALPGFAFGQPEPEPWYPPWIRILVTVDASAGVALGVHRPHVTVRSARRNGELLASFDFDLHVLARDPGKARLRLALGAGGIAAALAFVTATQQHSVSPTLGLPASFAFLAGGVGAWVTMRPEMIMTEIRDQSTDVLIVTAVKGEYDAVTAIDTDAAPGSAWVTRQGSTNLDVAFRAFTTTNGVMRVAVVQALGMGAANALAASAQLIKDYGIRCLAMCGVCAGRRGEVALGDVIVADRLWQYDTGKHKAGVDEEGKRVEKDQGDIDMHKICPARWVQDAERFEVDPEAAWLAKRPRTYEQQGDWILERILRGADPETDPGHKTQCEHYDRALARLWKNGLLRDGTLHLTDAGRAHIERILRLHRGKLPEPAPFRVHVGPIASGNRVIEDAEIFPLLASNVRKVVGVEMEAAAIATLAHLQKLPHFVVMKAVMDHADPDKSDNFKEFAARASAECLIAFLRQNLPPV